MPEPTAPAPVKGAKDLAKKKIGPLKGWQWGAVIVGGLAVGWYLRRRGDDVEEGPAPVEEIAPDTALIPTATEGIVFPGTFPTSPGDDDITPEPPAETPATPDPPETIPTPEPLPAPAPQPPAAQCVSLRAEKSGVVGRINNVQAQINAQQRELGKCPNGNKGDNCRRNHKERIDRLRGDLDKLHKRNQQITADLKRLGCP